MNRNREYKDKVYKDAGVERGVAAKAMTVIIALILALVLTLTSCGSTAEAESGGGATSQTATETTYNAASKSEMFTERDLSGDYDESEAETITLSGSSIETSASSGVSIDGSTVTISAEGVYVVSGTLADGQIIVDADDAAKVQIVLKGASVTSSDSAAIYVKSADKVFVTTAEGTENTLANGGSFVADGDTNVDGAVFAKDDITFNGSGSLTIDSPAGHGIVGKDDVKIAGGTVTINAANHGIQANDSVRVAEATLTVNAQTKDGIHVSDDADEEEGTESDSFFYMSDGSLSVSAGDDGIHADAEVVVDDLGFGRGVRDVATLVKARAGGRDGAFAFILCPTGQPGCRGVADALVVHAAHVSVLVQRHNQLHRFARARLYRGVAYGGLVEQAAGRAADYQCLRVRHAIHLYIIIGEAEGALQCPVLFYNAFVVRCMHNQLAVHDVAHAAIAQSLAVDAEGIYAVLALGMIVGQAVHLVDDGRTLLFEPQVHAISCVGFVA